MYNLTLIMTVLTLVPIIAGALLGFTRGLKRSILRLIIVVAALIAAICLRGTLIKVIMDTEFSGQTLRESVVASFSDEYASLAKLVIPIIEILVGVIAFLLSFILLKFVSLIIFWIAKIFVRPGAHKGRLFGALVGAVQGLLVAYFICVPLNGLIGSVEKVSEIDISDYSTAAVYSTPSTCSAFYDEDYLTSSSGASNSGASSSSSNEDLEKLLNTLDLEGYKKSGICNFYTSVSFGVYDSLTTVKDEDGKNVTLSVQVDAVVAAAKVAKAAQKITNIDFTNDGLNEENVSQISDLFKEIDEIKNEMSEDAIQSLNDMIAVVGESFGEELGDIDLSNLDLAKVNFTAAGEAIEKAYDLQKAYEDKTIENIEEHIGDVVEKVVESNLAVAAADMGLNLSNILKDEEDKQSFLDIIDELQKEENGLNAENAEALKKIFGLSESTESGNEEE